MEISLSENDEKYLKSRNLYEEILITRNLIDKNTTSLQLFSEIKKKNKHFFKHKYWFASFVNNPTYIGWSRENIFKIKNYKKIYLRNTMIQQRITGFVMICVEKELWEQLNHNDLINDFLLKKVRKINEI